ncbi:MAG: trypsin-like peptidase domain-containing protein, partial [Clostridiales bacterium]|nr:trypsin-like peptidase domain-containing protein [Clostridiales bacterium]
VSPGILPLSAADQSTQARELSIPEIASLVANSVTEVFTEQIVRSGRMGQFVTEGAGSGVVISTDGYIVTNNHVIDGASKITVRLKNGTAYEAKLVGRDSKTDIAVLKINATGLQPAIYGNSESLVVGELAVAIGNPLGQLGGTVSEGIISALGRSIDIDGQTMNLLQTTAAVNPGNSGGGLFNRFGELVGVVNAKSSGSDIEGIGFAIPVSVVKSIAGSLAQYGYVPGRIDFGASLIDVLDARTAMMYRLQSAGVYVSWADAESGLKSGDRIISIDGKEIKSSADVSVILDAHKVGDTLAITVSRGGQNTTVNLKLKQAKNT